jgi:hypothetical protein
MIHCYAMSYSHSLSEASAENHASVLAALIQDRASYAKLGLDLESG